jgi:hypothetical protein
VWHTHAERLSDYLVKKARYGFFRVRVYRRYPQKALGDSYTPPLMAGQIALAGLTGLLAAGATVRVPGAVRVLGATAGAFGLSTLPLLRRASRTQPGLVPLVPLLVYARAWAQGLGIAAGLTMLAGERLAGARRARGQVGARDAVRSTCSGGHVRVDVDGAAMRARVR